MAGDHASGTSRSLVGSRVDFEAMNRAIAMHRLRPVIDRALLGSDELSYNLISVLESKE
jgi:hypothetical protein